MYSYVFSGGNKESNRLKTSERRLQEILWYLYTREEEDFQPTSLMSEPDSFFIVENS